MTNNNESKTAQAVRRQHSGDKTKLHYWKKRIFRPTYLRDGRKITSPNFCIELQHQGHRIRWSLGPGNPEAAAARARDLAMFLFNNGWDKTLEKYRPKTIAEPDPSVGLFIAQVQKTADLLPKTLKSYVASLRKIVSDILGGSDDSKYGHGKRRQAWLERIDNVKLSALTSDAIQEWKIAFIARAGADPIQTRSARVSANSFLRCAKSLFSPRVVKHVGLELPSPLPFSDVQFEPRQSTKYRSTFSITGLVEAASAELANEPEVYKAFLLASFAGLRRKEIDLLEWSSFLWDQNLIRIQTTAHFEAKSEDSLGDVAVDVQLMAIFRGYHQLASGAFVIESSEPPRSDCLYNYYRAEHVFTRLIEWLRGHGLTSLKPLHALRKEFGSEICRIAGIYAASRALRHSDIKIMCNYYVEARGHVTVGLGHLLAPDKIVEFKQQVA
jgi:integrase